MKKKKEEAQYVEWYDDTIVVENDIDLHEIGLDEESLHNDDGKWDEILESATDLEYKDLGFENQADYLDHNNEQERAFLMRYDDLFIVADWGAVVDRNGCGGVYDWLVTRNEKEAREYFDSLELLSAPPQDEIKAAKNSEVLRPYSDEIWIDARTETFYGVQYNVKYKGFLIVEKAWDLDPLEIARQIRKLEEILNTLRKEDIVLIALYKEPREWNNNQRYYAFEFERNGWEVDEKAHIPSKLQGKVRFPLDYFQTAWIDEIKQESEGCVNDPYYCPVCDDPDGCSFDEIEINGSCSKRTPVQEEDTDSNGRCIECGARLGRPHHVGCNREKIPGKTLLLNQYWMIDQDDDPDITYIKSCWFSGRAS